MYELTDPKIIKSLCARFGFTFSKSMGQNFITDPGVLMRIAARATDAAQGVIEIGPGFGSLTAALASRAEKVTAIELDRRLEPVLKETLAGFGNINLIWQDCLKVDFNELLNTRFAGMSVSVAANLPYYITTPILMNLIESRYPFKRIIVMVQKEVAERLCASPGGKEYGAVTLTTQYYTRPEILEIVPASSFIPAPKVDSAVISLELRDEPAVKPKDEKLFFTLIRAAFSQRRKTLLNCLANSGKFGTKETIEGAISALGKDVRLRGETLSIEEFAILTDIFMQNVENKERTMNLPKK